MLKLVFKGLLIIGLQLLLCCSKKGPLIESKSDNIVKEDFIEFYSKFTSDSLFQLSRIKFPLSGIQLDGDNSGIDPKTNQQFTGNTKWNKGNWVMIKKLDANDASDFDVEIINKSDSTYRITKAKEYGVYFEERYKLINNKWYLVYLIDKSL